MVNYQCIEIQLNSELSFLIISFIVFYVLLFLYLFRLQKELFWMPGPTPLLDSLFFSTYNSNSVFSFFFFFFWKTKALVPKTF